MATAVVLVNIGTPQTAQPSDVGVYLKEFLGDPDVIELPNPWRWVLVNWLIVPRRKHRSAEAYQKIWTPEGSPLKVLSDSLVAKLNREMPEDIQVFSVMRYGEESLARWWPRAAEFERVAVLPAFPQNATATTGSVNKACRQLQESLGFPQKIEFLPEFYHENFFIDSLAESIRAAQDSFDHLLFSYHGLPKNHILRDDPHPPTCLQAADCCERQAQADGGCYRAQCWRTTFEVTKRLNWSAGRYSMAFQSRLGRAEWLQPYTIDKVKELAAEGVKRLGVICPAFVVDCLETLEEIGIGMKEEFQQAGGEDLVLIPCLNDDDGWARRLAGHIVNSVKS